MKKRNRGLKKSLITIGLTKEYDVYIIKNLGFRNSSGG